MTDSDAGTTDVDGDGSAMDPETALAGARGKLALAAVFLVAIVAAELTDVSAPAIGLGTAFDVQAAIVGTFIVLFGGAQISHATDVAGSADEGTATQLQRGGAVIVLGGLVVLAVAFL
ncbi:hypothetical protein [Halorubellus sp. PRR65]|uniref:hypothetical protein n=1 Tax=Halorubellus sp. PRR65 TaxID=3098148 RepID=UPI002B2622A9|nr:hypothetical protein [Halorubellus sp. PRR65]